MRLSRGRPGLVSAGLVILAALSAAACTSQGPTTVPPIAGVHPAADQTDWPTFDRTSARDGVSVSSPAPKVIRKSWTSAVDGLVYAQPLIVGSDVIIATENDTVYALDATTGSVRWSRHLATPVTSGLPCGNVSPSGITGTPVADPAEQRLWVVTYTSKPAFRHTLWDLNIGNGRPVAQRTIDAAGSDPRAQQERGALTLLGSRVYVPFGGLFGDCSDYKGRVVGAPKSGKGPLVTFTTANKREGGIWAPAGESVSNGSLYVATGNSEPANQVADGDSVLRLSRQLTLIDRFTPSNFRQLSASDADLASTAPEVLPHGLMFQVGKEGVGYVLNSTRLGGTGGQLGSAKVCEGGFGGGAVSATTVVFSCFNSLRAISVRPGQQGVRPPIHSLWTVNDSSGPPIIAGGVVWDVNPDGGLSGYLLSSGKKVFSAPTADVGTDFPSLAASGTRLVVPEGTKVVSYTGI